MFLNGLSLKSKKLTTPEDILEYLSSGGEPSSGEHVNSETAMRVGTVMSCVWILSKVIAHIPVNIVKQVDEKRVEKQPRHPVARLLAVKPNAWQTPFQFWQMMASHTILRGNAYAFKARGRTGPVRQLIPLHPDRVTPRQEEDRRIKYDVSLPDGTQTEYDQSQMMHLTGLSMDGFMGMNPIQAQRESVGLAMAAQKHGARNFRNGVRFPGFLKLPGSFKDNEHREEFQRSWQENYTGGNQWKTPVLEQGMDFQAVGMSMEDAQYIDTRKFEQAQLAALFGVPLFLLNDTEKSTTWGTGLEQITLGFHRYTINPWLVSFENAVSRDLLDSDPMISANFDDRAFVRGDFKGRQEGLQIQRRNAIINANEWRAEIGLNPREDEGGEEYIYEANMTTGEDPNAQNPQDSSAT